MTATARLPSNSGCDAVEIAVADDGSFFGFHHWHKPLTNHLHPEGLDDLYETVVPAVPTSSDHLAELRTGFQEWVDAASEFRWSEKTEAGVLVEFRLAARTEGLIVGPGKAAFTWLISNGASFRAERSFVVDPSCIRIFLEDFVVPCDDRDGVDRGV